VSRNRPTDFNSTVRNAREYDRANVERTAHTLVGAYYWRTAYDRNGALSCALAVVVGVVGEGASMRVVLRGNGTIRRVSAGTFSREWFAVRAVELDSNPRPVVLPSGALLWVRA